MNLELILAAGIISFLLMYFANAIRQEEGHFILRYISYSIGIVLLIIVAKGAIDGEQNCELVLNLTQETWVYGSNFTGYHWDYRGDSLSQVTETGAYPFHRNTTHTYATICYEKTQSTSAKTLYRIANWVFILYIAYVMIYLIYWVFIKVQTWWRRR